MRFQDLRIQTHRVAPSRARSSGAQLLFRAGYVTQGGQLTPLGDCVVSRLKSFSGGPRSFFPFIGLDVLETAAFEFVVRVESGDFDLLRCTACGYGAAREAASAKKQPMPAEELRPVEQILTPNCSTIESLAAFLGVPVERTAKAMMYTRPTDGKFVFVVLRGDTQLSQRKLRDQLGDLQPATSESIATAGAVAGYASPIGLLDAFVAVDDLIPVSCNLIAGANKAGYHLLNTNLGRDYTPHVVADLTLAHPEDPCPKCDGKLESVRGLLVADADGYRFPSILLALAEMHHDERGLRLPASAAPFEVYLLNIPSRELDTRDASLEIYQELQGAGVAVLFDDREEGAGVKFNDADLIGCPLRVTVGERNLKNRMVELKERDRDTLRLVPAHEIVGALGGAPGNTP